MTAPVLQFIGNQAAGTTAQNVAWPGGHQAGDLGILVIENSGNDTTQTGPSGSGWTQVTGSPVTAVATTAGSKLVVWYKFATSSTEANVSTGDAGDHQVARIYVFRGVSQTGTFNASTTGTKTTASTTATWPSITTTVGETRVVFIASRPDDTNTNTDIFRNYTGGTLDAVPAELSASAEATTSAGNGGGFVLVTATKTAPGATGTPSASMFNNSNGSLSVTNAYMVFALRPKDFTLTADTQTYNETLQPATLTVDRTLTASSDTFAFNGNDVTLTKTTPAKILTAEFVNFDLIERDATLRKTWRVRADSSGFGIDDFTTNSVFSDNFNRANGALGSNWQIEQGSFQIINNAVNSLFVASTSIATVTSGTYSSDQYAQITAVSFTASYFDWIGVGVRVSGLSGYFFATDSLSVRKLFKRDSSGVATEIGTKDIYWVAGDIIKITANRNIISVYKNNQLVDQVKDSTYTSGVPAIYYRKENNSTTTGDNFEAGSLLDNTALKVSRVLSCATSLYSVEGTETNFNRGVSLTADSQPYTFIGRDATLFPSRYLSLARTTFTITGPPASLIAIADTHTVTIDPPAGWALHLVTDVSQAGISACIYYNLSPAVAVGDQILYRTTTETNSNAVSVSSTGIVSTVPSGSDTLKFRHWRPSTWSAELTFTVGITARTLTADTQTYTEDLQPANLTIGRKLIARSGVFGIDTNVYSQVFSDNFNRVNSNSLGANWQVNKSSFRIVNNKFTGTTTYLDFSLAEVLVGSYNADQFAEVTVDNSAFVGRAGVGVRTSGMQGYYLALWPTATDNQLLYLTKVNSSGVETELLYWTPYLPSSSTITIKLKVVGNILSIYSNNTLIKTVVDSSYSFGKPGLYYKSVLGETYGDNFVAGNTVDNANLKASRTLSCDPATYTEDLQPANLTVGRKQVSGGSVYRIKTEINGPALFTDTITQPNGTILGDTAEWDSWDTDNATQIVSFDSNAVISQQNRDNVGVIVATVSFGPDQWSEQVHQTGSNNRLGAGPIVRGTSGLLTNGYVFRPEVIPTTTFNIYKYVNGVGSIIASSGPEIVSTLSSGTYTSRLEIVGSRLYGYLNGKLVVTAVDSSITTGQPGFQIYYSGGTTSFSAGQIEASTTGLVASRTLSCDPATYAEDLQPANLIVGRKLIAKVYADEQLFSDDFTGAAAVLGSNYTQQGDALLRLDGLGNVYNATSSARAIAWPNSVTFATDQYAEITLTQIASANSGNSGILLRTQTTEPIGIEKGYTFKTGDNGQAYTLKEYNESSTDILLASTTIIPKVGDRLRAVVFNNTLYFYVNNQLIASASDTSWTTGIPAIYGFSNGWKSDNFVAGNYGGLHLAGTYTNTLAARTLSCDPATYSEDLKPANLIAARSLAANTTFFRLKTLALQTDFSDNFNRANESLDASANWQPADLEVGSLAIVGNAVTGVDKGNVYSSTLANNQWAEFTFSNVFSSGTDKGAAVLLRATGNASSFTGYSISVSRENTQPNTDLLQIRRVLDSTNYTNAFELGALLLYFRIPEFSNGGNVVLRAEIVGSNIYVYINNVYRATISDGVITSGKAGIWSDSAVIDNFSCGSFTDTLFLKANRTLSCDPATYTLELKDATLTKVSAKVLTADSQTYTEDLQPANLIAARKLSAEEFRANYIRNSMMVGTVAGTPGTAPTLWFTTQAAWATRTIIGTGIDATTGLTYIDISYSGTNNTGSISNLILDPITASTQSASIGQTWTSSSYFGLLSGAWPTDANIVTIARDAAIGAVGNSTVSIKSISSSTLQRFTATHTISNSTTIYIQTSIRFGIPNGETVSFTIRIAAPQLERGSVARAFIPTTNAVVYRSFELAGQPVNLLENRRLVADSQIYTFIGRDVSFSSAEVFGTISRQYTLSGNNVLFLRSVISSSVAYTFTGRDANLFRGERVTAESRAYNLTGRDAALNHAARVTADTSTFTLTGRDSNLLRGERLTADTSTYTFTGRDASLLRAERVTADVSSYSLSGQSANLLKNTRLVSDVQSYVFSGIDAIFRAARRLPAEEFRANYIRNSMMVGTIAGTPGTAPNLWATFVPTWCTRTIVGTGIDSTTGLTYIDVALSGTNSSGATSSILLDPINSTTAPAGAGQTWVSSAYFGLLVGSWPTSAVSIGTVSRDSLGSGTGNQYISIKGVSGSSLQRVSATYTIVSSSARYIQTVIRFDLLANDSLNLTIRIAAPQLERGSVARTFIPTTNAVQYRWFELAGQSANLLENRRLVAESSSYTLTRNDANLSVTRKLVADSSSYALTGNNVLFAITGSLNVTTATFTLTGNSVNFVRSRILVAATQPYNFVPKDAILKTSKKVIADKATYTLTGRAANLAAGEISTSDSQSFILTGNSVRFNRSVKSIVSSYTLTASDTSLKVGRKISLTVSSYITSGVAVNLLANKKISAVRVFFDTNGYVDPGYTDPNYVSIDAGIISSRLIIGQTITYNLNGNIVIIVRGGFIKVWTGSAWVSKPLKVWDGTAWVSKPLKVWTGSTWRTY